MRNILKTYAPWVIIGILVMLLFFTRQCSPGCPEPVIKETHDTIPGDSIPYEVEVPKPYPVFQKVPPDTFWKDADTAAILAACHGMAVDYNTRRMYDQILLDDTSALVRLIDTVFQNGLQGRKLIFQNRRATVINNTYVTYGDKPRNQVFIGPAIGRSLDRFAVGGQVLLVGKKNMAYSYTYDALNNDHYIGLLYKISFRKRK